MDNGLKLSFYDLNKSAYGTLPEYDNAKISELQNRINNWENANTYFMLLCNDIKYYTVLRRTQHKKAEFADLGQAVTKLLLERDYTILADEITNDYFEIWIKDQKNDDVHMFALFPYDWGVINYG